MFSGRAVGRKEGALKVLKTDNTHQIEAPTIADTPAGSLRKSHSIFYGFFGRFTTSQRTLNDLERQRQFSLSLQLTVRQQRLRNAAVNAAVRTVECIREQFVAGRFLGDKTGVDQWSKKLSTQAVEETVAMLWRRWKQCKHGNSLGMLLRKESQKQNLETLNSPFCSLKWSEYLRTWS